MTKQEQNDIIIRHMDAELRDTPNVQERVAHAFTKWFQNLVQMATMPAQPEPEEGEPA